MFKKNKETVAPKKSAWQYSLDLLNRRMKTELELLKKLTEKGYEESEIKSTILKLKEHQFINDSNYARLYAEFKSKKGNFTIQRELKTRGIQKEIISTAIENLEDEFLRALPVGEKKWYSILKKDNIELIEKKDKLIRFLNSRGFSYNVCVKVTNKITNTITDYDTEQSL